MYFVGSVIFIAFFALDYTFNKKNSPLKFCGIQKSLHLMSPNVAEQGAIKYSVMQTT